MLLFEFRREPKDAIADRFAQVRGHLHKFGDATPENQRLVIVKTASPSRGVKNDAASSNDGRQIAIVRVNRRV
jgi:hypothetical protein